MAVCFGALERRVVVDAGEEPAADQGVEPRVGVPSRYVDAFSHLAVHVPLDRDPVGCILGAQPTGKGDGCGPDVLESNQADPANRVTVNDLGPKGRGEHPLHRLWVDVEIDEYPSIYYA